jgi:general secretion pathway protein F
MPVYSYVGLSSEGRNVSGVIDADSPRSARLKLRRSGVYPTAVAETHDASTARASRPVSRLF